MAPNRCLFCTQPPLDEVAVMKWAGEDRQRLTIQLCARHLAKIRKAGAAGWANDGWRYKEGWW